MCKIKTTLKNSNCSIGPGYSFSLLDVTGNKKMVRQCFLPRSSINLFLYIKIKKKIAIKTDRKKLAVVNLEIICKLKNKLTDNINTTSFH